MQKPVILITLAVMLLFPSCENSHTWLKVKMPTNGEVFNAPEVIEIKADMADPDFLYYATLVVTKTNNTRDTIINSRIDKPVERDNVFHLTDSFASGPATQYKIVVYANGVNGSASDTIFVSTN